jgi:hypothetical protein
MSEIGIAEITHTIKTVKISSQYGCGPVEFTGHEPHSACSHLRAATFRVWKNDLYLFAPLLFQDKIRRRIRIRWRRIVWGLQLFPAVQPLIPVGHRLSRV